MQLFYNPDFNIQAPFLLEDEARHCLKVLRIKKGDIVHVTDGNGNIFETRLLTEDPKKCQLQIISTQTESYKPYTIHIAIAPTKNADRTEWMVEKCVELGVDEISFIACEHSERKFFKTDRVEKIAIAAMKQSLKSRLPAIHEIISYKKFIEQPLPEQRFIAHLEEGKRELLQQLAQQGKEYCVLIGPEGDFSPEEIRLAQAKGFLAVSLGESRLRTETAGIVACHILNLINSR
ncbi:16S rRNA (uracil(1498)-N(3))-methyltransferase [Rhodocytophaga rosea]|uniref:Ribosomal RNA small subunit methyltransferase E n=1 Tax=Rhodocytophaga rosea TaxID=2704465 RepID=A0A6C0GMQ0_9BACT|nr:16S rRNA (uracil(1498)-N(3))-methyltransferase [Rhodocytophaga rosea]QHT69316.1 16S rRNA (uracil(1498)-N(3))-methyltransferase [Rhodocytophaga rosea]